MQAILLTVKGRLSNKLIFYILLIYIVVSIFQILPNQFYFFTFLIFMFYLPFIFFFIFYVLFSLL